MHIIVLIPAFLIFLYCLYILGRDDITFIRKNVSLEQLFNIAFITFLVGMLAARILYVALNPSRDYLNPLVFFIFPYFPGLSWLGGVLGGSLFLLYHAKRRKLPVGRIFDYFAISFLCAAPYGIVGSFFLDNTPRTIDVWLLPIIYMLLFIFFMKIIHPKLMQGNVRHGSAGILVLVIFSLLFFLTSMVQDVQKIYYFVGVEEIVAALIFFFSFILLIKQVSQPAKG